MLFVDLILEAKLNIGMPRFLTALSVIKSMLCCSSLQIYLAGLLVFDNTVASTSSKDVQLRWLRVGKLTVKTCCSGFDSRLGRQPSAASTSGLLELHYVVVGPAVMVA